MPGLNSIQRGSFTLTSASANPFDVTISAVTLASSFVMFTWRTAHGDTGTSLRLLRHYLTAHLQATTTLRFQRWESQFANDVIVDWTVLDVSGAFVQTGEITADAATETIPITQVDRTRSIVITSLRTDMVGSPDGEAVAFTATLDATGENVVLNFGQAPVGNDAIVRWTVVQFPVGSVSVQHIPISMSSAETTKSATISSVTVAKSILLPSGMDLAMEIEGRQNYTAVFNSATEIQVQRQNIGTIVAADVVVQVMTFLDATTVEYGTATIANGATAPASPPTFSEKSANACVMNAHLRGNTRGTSTSAGLELDDTECTIALDDPPDGLTITRVGTENELVAGYAVVDWQEVAAPSPDGWGQPLAHPLGAPFEVVSYFRRSGKLFLPDRRLWLPRPA